MLGELPDMSTPSTRGPLSVGHRRADKAVHNKADYAGELAGPVAVASRAVCRQLGGAVAGPLAGGSDAEVPWCAWIGCGYATRPQTRS